MILRKSLFISKNQLWLVNLHILGSLCTLDGETGLSAADQNIHPPFELISESVRESWNGSSTANEFGLKMKELYIEVHDKVCLIEG